MNTTRTLATALIASALTIAAPSPPATACRAIATPQGYAACAHINKHRIESFVKTKNHKKTKTRKPNGGTHWAIQTTD